MSHVFPNIFLNHFVCQLAWIRPRDDDELSRFKLEVVKRHVIVCIESCVRNDTRGTSGNVTARVIIPWRHSSNVGCDEVPVTISNCIQDGKGRWRRRRGCWPVLARVRSNERENVVSNDSTLVISKLKSSVVLLQVWQKWKRPQDVWVSTFVQENLKAMNVVVDLTEKILNQLLWTCECSKHVFTSTLTVS